MGIKLNLNQTVDLGVVGSVDGEYLYETITPEKCSIDSNGVVTALKPGLGVVKITRLSDGMILAKIRISIPDPKELAPEIKPTITIIDL